MRFNPADANGVVSIVFYSVPSAANALADTGLPTANYANQVTLPELPAGPGGVDGAFYLPSPGQPGSFGTGPQGLAYAFISDGRLGDTGIPGVPEPAAWASMLLGLGVVGAGLRSRRSAAAAAA